MSLDEHPPDEATATDNCGEVVITVEEVTTAGACCDYVITRTFTATDDCGNASSATQTITIIDTTAPELTIPADYTAECSDEHPMDEATATDNCGEVVITVEEVTTSGACAGDYVITVRSLLLMTVVTHLALLRLSLSSTLRLQSSLQFQLDYTAECSDGTPMDQATATDNCGGGGYHRRRSYYYWRLCWRLRTTRTFTATDNYCGNATTSATQTITIIDTTAPVFTSIPADYTAECSTNTQWMKLLLLTTVEKWLSL